MKRIVSLLLLLSYLIMMMACTKTPDVPDTEEGNTDGGYTEEKPHVCEFTEKVAKAKYIKERATCTRAAEYFLSCTCANNVHRERDLGKR